MAKRVGLKYCGGCNPTYERVAYVRQIQEAAGDRVDWVRPEAGGLSALLLVNGCDKQCADMAEFEDTETAPRVVRLRDARSEPAHILSLLLEGDP